MQLQAKQFQKHFGIPHGHRQVSRLFRKRRAQARQKIFRSRIVNYFLESVQIESQANGAGGERTRRQPRAQLIEQAAKQESQRLEFRDGIFECHFFLETSRRFDEHERTLTRPARQFMQPNSFLPQTFRKLQKRQCRQRRASAHAPALERFENFEGRRKHTDRQAAQALRFLAGRNHGDTRKTARGVDGCFEIGRDRNVDEQAEAAARRSNSSAMFSSESNKEASPARSRTIVSEPYLPRAGKPTSQDRAKRHEWTFPALASGCGFRCR